MKYINFPFVSIFPRIYI